MTDRLQIAESVRASWASLPDDQRIRARHALTRIADDPLSGVPLSDPVKGYWSLRDARLRVIYRLVPQTGGVVILRLGFVKGSEP